MKEIWRNLDGPPKNKELCSYLVSFEISMPNVAQTAELYPTPTYAGDECYSIFSRGDNSAVSR